MSLKIKIIYFFIILFLTFKPVYSDEKIAYLDMEYVVKNSNIGKSILTKINELNTKNIETLKSREEILKTKEEEIKKKQNIVSKEELDKEIIELRKKINNLRKEKDEMINNLNEFKNNELKNFYEKINPIIQAYMEKNNISIILDMKNIIIGKSNSNITNNIINEINTKFD